MLSWLIAIVAGAAFAVGQYRWGGARQQVRLQALRAVAVTGVLAALLNAPVGWSRALAPFVALDASASWLATGDTTTWTRARAAVDSIGADSVVLVGDSVRAAQPPAAPTDSRSRVAPLVERALGAGRPVLLVTDGRIADPERLQDLPSGSEVVLIGSQGRPDVAVSALSLPSAAVTGDSVDVAAVVVAGAAGSPAARVDLALDGVSAGVVTVDSLGAHGEREVRWRVGLGGKAGWRLFRATVSAPTDAVPANDTLHAALDVAEGASAVFVSTAPDYDARFALDVLRGTLAVPTRGYYRVAEGQWRVDGTLAAVPESDVRRAATDAPIVVLHGDTAVFGAPRGIVRGALGLIVPPPPRGEEYYPTAAPPSPLMGTFGALPWDSLPPIEVGDQPRTSEWTGLVARRGRRLDERRVVAGWSSPERTVVVPASGMWRWRFRGGRSADTFVSFWGSVFDWLAGETTDLRGPRPASPWARAGEPIRWRRGGHADSTATVVLTRRGSRAVDTVTLAFPGTSSQAESPALAAGVYDGRTGSGNILVVVNASAEWTPRRATVRSGAIGGGASAGAAPRSRTAWWLYAIVIAALCVEWVLRRKIGLR